MLSLSLLSLLLGWDGTGLVGAGRGSVWSPVARGGGVSLSGLLLLQWGASRVAEALRGRSVPIRRPAVDNRRPPWLQAEIIYRTLDKSLLKASKEISSPSFHGRGWDVPMAKRDV